MTILSSCVVLDVMSTYRVQRLDGALQGIVSLCLSFPMTHMQRLSL